jgi:hypothetical protein
MIVKKNKVIVIDKKDQDKYMKQGWELAEEVGLNEGTIDKVKEIASKKQAMKIDGVMVDSFTASAISQIYDKVNDANKKKMDSLPITKLANLAMKMMQKNDYVPEEVELDEKMSPSDQDRLDDLLMAYRWGKSSYGFDDYGFDDYNDIPNPDDVVKLIRKEFGNKIADQLVKSDDKIKVGHGPSDRKTPTRITKKGKANKADLNALKTRLKKKRDWDKIAPKGKLPEEVDLDEGKMKNTTMQANKPRFERKGQELEAYAKKSGGIDKDDMMKVAAMLKRGDKSGALKYAKTLDTDPKEYIMSLIGEETELDEGKMGDQWQKGAKSVKSGPFELMRGKSGVHAIMQNGKKLGDFSYDDEADNFVANMKGMKGQWVGNDIDSLINHLQKVHKEEVDLEEASASADARRAMRRDPDMKQRAFSKDDDATDDDKKAASKNIMVQMRKAQSLGYFNVEFQDGKKIKIPAKLAIAVQQKYNAMRKPSDKESFQAKVGKSYRDMLNALKEEAVSPAQQAAIAISKKERGEKPKKESILDRIDRKIKENKNG